MAEVNEIDLKQAKSVSLTTLVDNYSDVLLPNEEHVERAPLIKEGMRTKPLLAEHGFSLMIEVIDNLEHHNIIMDFGVSDIAMPHNMSVLEVDVAKVEAFIISHGHHDHIGAIREVLNALPKPAEVIVHPNAFLENRMHKFPDGKEVPIPSLRRESIKPLGCSIVQVVSPTLLANGCIATLTDIPRVTDYEKGLPNAYYKEDGIFRKDEIKDDQGLVINIRDKGLVVITGCGHSGIINTIRYAQKITGVEKIYAVIGGFHLNGPYFEAIIPQTVEDIKRFSPKVIVPCHCTGWEAINEFKKAFPNNFFLNSVGTKIVL